MYDFFIYFLKKNFDFLFILLLYYLIFIKQNSSIESFPLWLILILGGLLCCIVLIVGIVCWLKKRHAEQTAMHDPNPDDYIETDLDDKSDITEDESVYQHSTDGIYAVVPDVNNDTIIYDVVTN